MKKKVVISLIVILIVLIVLLVALSRREWVVISTGEGHYSKDTYLDGGTDYININKNVRITEDFIINKGSIRFIVKDVSSGKEYYNETFSETGTKIISFQNEKTVECEYITELSDDADIVSTTKVEEYQNYFDKLRIKREDQKSFDELFDHK